MMTSPPLVRACRLLLLTLVWATAAPAEEILDYRVDLTGTADGSLLVEERIEYDFGDLQRHGIYRDIPDSVPGPWGARRTLPIDRIAVERDQQAAGFARESVHGDAGPMLRLRIGDPDSTISGRHSYSIRYRVEDSLLPAGERDAFRWNAIGTGWNVPIRSAQVRLKLPAELQGRPDLEGSFFTGPWGSTARNGHAEWSGDGGVYSVTAGPLRRHEGVTVEVSFPAGAISATTRLSSVQKFRQTLPLLWGWVLMAIGLGFAFRHWNREGRDPGIGPIAVRYRPPQDLEAAEAGLLLDQSLDNADLIGSVIELARDGWLKIERPEQPGGILKLIKRNRITLECVRPRKDWSRLPPYKRYLLESFFCQGDRFAPGGQESAAIVRERNRWLDKAKSRIHERGVEHGLFPESPKKVRIKYVTGAGTLGLLLLVVAFWRSPMNFSLSNWGFLLFDPLVPTVILVAGLLLLAWQMPRRTKKGAQTRRELLGFKKFMERAEAPRLRALLQEDPEYFEHTLPFAALFGLVTRWSERFEGLTAMPVWYEGGSMHHLGSDLKHLSSSGVTSSPPASSGGSSGGGGFSGGGGGGGGGGSW